MLWEIFMAVVPSLLTGVVLAIFNSKQKKRMKENDQLEFDRKKESKLNLDLTFASAQLAYASAIALKRGYANGEVEQGVESYQKALDAYRKFEREKIADMII